MNMFETEYFIRIDDLVERRKVAEELRLLGYHVCPCVTMGSESDDSPCFVFNTREGNVHIVDIPDVENDVIECLDIPTFLEKVGNNKIKID